MKPVLVRLHWSRLRMSVCLINQAFSSAWMNGIAAVAYSPLGLTKRGSAMVHFSRVVGMRGCVFIQHKNSLLPVQRGWRLWPRLIWSPITWEPPLSNCQTEKSCCFQVYLMVGMQCKSSRLCFPNWGEFAFSHWEIRILSKNCNQVDLLDSEG